MFARNRYRYAAGDSYSSLLFELEIVKDEGKKYRVCEDFSIKNHIIMNI
jgi:hypothetical protein